MQMFPLGYTRLIKVEHCICGCTSTFWTIRQMYCTFCEYIPHWTMQMFPLGYTRLIKVEHCICGCTSTFWTIRQMYGTFCEYIPHCEQCKCFLSVIHGWSNWNIVRLWLNSTFWTFGACIPRFVRIFHILDNTIVIVYLFCALGPSKLHFLDNLHVWHGWNVPFVEIAHVLIPNSRFTKT